jgi:hypothetical protein
LPDDPAAKQPATAPAAPSLPRDEAHVLAVGGREVLKI